MMVVDPAAEERAVGGEVFEPDAEFLRLLQPALPVVVGCERTVHLGAGGEAGLDRAPGQPVSLGAIGSGCPSYEHGGSFAPKIASAKPNVEAATDGSSKQDR